MSKTFRLLFLSFPFSFSLARFYPFCRPASLADEILLKVGNMIKNPADVVIDLLCKNSSQNQNSGVTGSDLIHVIFPYLPGIPADEIIPWIEKNPKKDTEVRFIQPLVSQTNVLFWT